MQETNVRMTAEELAEYEAFKAEKEKKAAEERRRQQREDYTKRWWTTNCRPPSRSCRT